MKPTRLILIPSLGGDPAPFVVIHDGRVRDRGVLALHAVDRPEPMRTVAVAPGADVTIRWLDLPAGGVAQQRAAALWMLKDVFLPGVGPSMMAPSGTHGRMQKAMERGGLGGMLLAGVLVGICTVPCSGAMYLQITAVLHASGGGLTGLALLALYNIAFIVPLVVMLLAVSNRRVLGQIGRWNRANSPWIKAGIALAIIAMSFGLMVSM